MDNQLCFARTEKGRDELLGGGRTLKPRQRQVLFLVSDAISVQGLKEKLPTCQELENILEQLWEGGYIGQVKSFHAPVSSAAAPARSPFEAAREMALHVLATLVGEHSPVYAQVAKAGDSAALMEAVAAGKRILASVASTQQAEAFVRDVTALLGRVKVGTPINGIASAKVRALEIICSLVGDRSPVYAKVNGANDRDDFLTAVSAGKKVIAAVASSSHAQNFESEVMGLLESH